MRVGHVVSPLGSYFTPDKGAVSPKLFLCASVPGMVLVSTGSSQYLETTISLPDPLGGPAHPQHIAYDARRSTACVGDPSADGVVAGSPSHADVTSSRCGRIRAGEVMWAVRLRQERSML